MAASQSLTIVCFLAASALAFGLRDSKSNKSSRVHGLHGEKLETIPMFKYKSDCWQKRPMVMTELAQKVYKKVNKTSIPGAGMEPEKIEPFVNVLKDGFFEVACVKDYMYNHGDKFGSNKHEYKVGGLSNVSIVHYKAIVPSEDQKPMSQEVCYEFCRTVPDMLFFGLMAGRECYCAPFFKPMAGDSSQCDAVCEGAPTTMCGGMAKQGIFEMHLCADTAEDVASALEKAEDLGSKMAEIGKTAEKDAKKMQSVAEPMQKAFGSAGDPVASDLIQSAKVFAGEVQHAGEDTTKISDEMEELHGKLSELKDADFTKQDNIKEAESLLDELEKKMTEGEKSLETTLDVLSLVKGEEVTAEEEEEAEEEDSKALDQYKSIMYFVDKEFVEVPATCGGETIKKPIFTKEPTQCAKACDAEGIACAGFQFVKRKFGLCFLFTKFKSVQYYTGCGKEFLQTARATSFLQLGQEKWSEDTMCLAKFSSFSGTSLKPDPSGKCKLCLKTADKAQRCFESE